MLTLTRQDGHEFAPPCFSQLNAPALVSYHQERDLPHPITAFNTSWWKLRAQFTSILDLLNGYSVGGGSDRDHPIMDAVEALYFRAANFIDVLERIVPEALLPQEKGRFNLPRGLRSDLMMPANKLKHEANVITLCGAKWWAVNVPAFMIFHMRGTSKIANPIFHARRDAFSFNVELRRLLVKIYRFAAAVGEQVAELGYGTSQPTGMSAENEALLRRLAEMPNYCWWDEDRLMPTFAFDGEMLKLDEKGGLAKQVMRHEATFTAIGTMDGYSRSIGFRGRTT